MNTKIKAEAVAIALVLLFTVKHAAGVLYDISPLRFGIAWADWLYCCLACIAIDWAVLLFARNGMKVQAGTFSVAILLLNGLYFNKEFLPQDYPFYEVAASVIFSLTFAYSIYAFSELYLEEKKVEIEQRQKEEKRRAIVKAARVKEEGKKEVPKRGKGEITPVKNRVKYLKKLERVGKLTPAKEEELKNLTLV